MNPLYLILALPAFLAFQVAAKGLRWFRSGVAGLAGYEYSKAENPGWYLLTIVGCLLLLAFYLASAFFAFISIKVGGRDNFWVLTFFYLLLSVAQNINISKKPQS